MNSPTPSIDPSEPETERRLIEMSIQKLADPGTLKQVNLKAAGKYLYAKGLHVDENGFIVYPNSEEYATPYTFSRDKFRETDTPSENPLQEYFVPLTDDEYVPGVSTKERLHLTDLHAVIHGESERPHPVIDDVFAIEEFHQHVGITFSTVMGWSSAVQMAHGNGFEDSVQVYISSLPLPDTSDPSIELTCFAPDCGFSGPIDEWNGEPNNPTCPDCGNEWDETITVCMNCQKWHMGSHFEGDTIYAEPCCPHCNAGAEHLEIQTRYDEFTNPNNSVPLTNQ